MKSAPGQPGLPPCWTSGAKTGVGTALDPTSRAWFTLRHGCVDEVYFGRVDRACVRGLRLIVTAGPSFFSDDHHDTEAFSEPIAPGVPAFRTRSICRERRYRLEREILTDPTRDVLLQRIRFVPLHGRIEDYRLHVFLEPHLDNHGAGNTGWVGEDERVPMLFASRGRLTLALACSRPFSTRSAGFVGRTDGRDDLRRSGKLANVYERAENGNVALVGEIPVGDDAFVIALAFGDDALSASDAAQSSLTEGFDAASSQYEAGWRAWQATLSLTGGHDIRRASAAVLRTHEDKSAPGGIVASLSVPWGMAKGDEDLGGYHLVWPRDLVEIAGGLLAVGARDDALRVLDFLQRTQQPDGRWPQNMWVDGTPCWTSLQLDEIALPILLVELAAHEGVPQSVLERYWPMVRRAASFIVQNGPISPQERWEETAGHSPFTLATEIGALLAAAEIATAHGDPIAARYLIETADTWNGDIERWLYVTQTDLSKRLGVDGYYVRVAPPGCSAMPRSLALKNKPLESPLSATAIVSSDALALVRLGLRRHDDPRILDTLEVIDALLKVETPRGPGWRRYNEDSYGEHADGAPFDGVGVGRPWPLLTGERAHYELAAGRFDEARRLARALEAFANNGMIPEQVWDGPDVPEHDLVFGGPTGSAMPLAWAHAEHLKLRRSLDDGVVFDLPRQVLARYAGRVPSSRYAAWRFEHPCHCIETGKTLRVELRAPAYVRFGVNDWRGVREIETRDTGLGMHVADLPTDRLPANTMVDLRFIGSGTAPWEARDHRVHVGALHGAAETLGTGTPPLTSVCGHCG